VTAIVTCSETISVGQAIVCSGAAVTAARSCYFEDDETTGYFYALDESSNGQRIADAMHIYNVAQVTDRAKPSSLEIVWSEGDRAAALLINRYVHAVFDFERKIGYCRTGFPPPRRTGSWSGHQWNDEALRLFD